MEQDTRKFRVILLTHGGAEKVLMHLCSVDCATVVGVIIETTSTPSRSWSQKITRSIRYDGYAATLAKLLRALSGIKGGIAGADNHSENLSDLREIAETHGIPIYHVANYHDIRTISLLRSLNPDLAVVFGTNILKESVFRIPKLGAINFHSGLVPQYRGGPPVFWELFNNENEVGLTVHWVASKVDAGDVISQEIVPLVYDYSYDTEFESFIAQYRRSLTDKVAQMLAESVSSIAKGVDSRLTQDLNKGRRYRLPTKKEKDELRRRLKRRKTQSTSQKRAGEHK